MAQAPREVILWVAHHILPLEPRIRTWLAGIGVSAADAEDLVHDAYCRLSELASVAHIDNPHGYFLTIVRNLHREQLRRQRVVQFEALSEDIGAVLIDERENPENLADARHQLALIDKLLAHLPERCREIFRLRRMEGISQKEIASRLGVTESIVENDSAKGLRVILAALRPAEDAIAGATFNQRSA